MATSIRGTAEHRRLPVTTGERQAGAAWKLLDCRVCGAPNGAHREGCFNCGSLLRVAREPLEPLVERQFVRDADSPGRVVYLRR